MPDVVIITMAPSIRLQHRRCTQTVGGCIRRTCMRKRRGYNVCHVWCARASARCDSAAATRAIKRASTRSRIAPRAALCVASIAPIHFALGYLYYDCHVTLASTWPPCDCYTQLPWATQHNSLHTQQHGSTVSTHETLRRSLSTSGLPHSHMTRKRAQTRACQPGPTLLPPLMAPLSHTAAHSGCSAPRRMGGTMCDRGQCASPRTCAGGAYVACSRTPVSVRCRRLASSLPTDGRRRNCRSGSNWRCMRRRSRS
jgi:hypothetical protein